MIVLQFFYNAPERSSPVRNDLNRYPLDGSRIFSIMLIYMSYNQVWSPPEPVVQFCNAARIFVRRTRL
jgi:hypothetical protein